VEIPLKWAIVEVYDSEYGAKYHKILAGWPDRWRLSSGITNVVDCGNLWEITNRSGSLYVCYKDLEGFTQYSENIYKGFEAANTSDLNVKLLLLDQIRYLYEQRS
jgi:hypothetical protein